MSDGPSHFRNETIRLLKKGLRVPHHCTLPYCPWSNGAVERLGKEVHRVARTILSEFQQLHTSWPPIFALIQSSINKTPSSIRGNHAPITIFTRRPVSLPVNTFFGGDRSKMITLSELKYQNTVVDENLTKAMDSLHSQIHAAVTHHRQVTRKNVSKGQPSNFSQCDYVLVSRENFLPGKVAFVLARFELCCESIILLCIFS